MFLLNFFRWSVNTVPLLTHQRENKISTTVFQLIPNFLQPCFSGKIYNKMILSREKNSNLLSEQQKKKQKKKTKQTHTHTQKKKKKKKTDWSALQRKSNKVLSRVSDYSTWLYKLITDNNVPYLRQWETFPVQFKQWAFFWNKTAP